MEIVLQLVTAFLGTLGFSLIFQVRKSLLLWTSLGGLFSWAIYLSLKALLGTVFLPYMLAAVGAAIYAEVMARVRKVPATAFLITALVPSIPGGSLYYTMSYAVRKDFLQAEGYGLRTTQYALAIACGISIVWAACQILMKIEQEKKVL